jgi:exodeoxyribonuclease VII large subunit
LNELLALRRQKLDDISGRLGRSLKAEVSVKRKGYDGFAPRLAPQLLDRAFARSRERLGLLGGRASAARGAALRDAKRRYHVTAARHDIDSVARLVARQRQRLEQGGRLLRSYSYEAVLDRGYALVIGPGGEAVRSADQVSTGDPLMIRVASGDFGATVSGPGRPKSRRSLPRSSVRPEQGKLF